MARADRRRGVDGPATGSDATRRRGVSGAGGGGGGGASSISTSSPSARSSSSDEIEFDKDALRTGSTRVEVVVAARRGVVAVVVVRGRFEGVSGAKTPSCSFSEADASEEESVKATLRFVGLLLAWESALLAVSRRADFVGEADRDCGWDCEGVLLGVFFDALVVASVVVLLLLLLLLVAAFFRRISLIVARMDSFRSTHPSSIVCTRREKTSGDRPYLSTSGARCTVESWFVREGGGGGCLCERGRSRLGLRQRFAIFNAP